MGGVGFRIFGPPFFAALDIHVFNLLADCRKLAVDRTKYSLRRTIGPWFLQPYLRLIVGVLFLLFAGHVFVVLSAVCYFVTDYMRHVLRRASQKIKEDHKAARILPQHESPATVRNLPES